MTTYPEKYAIEIVPQYRSKDEKLHATPEAAAATNRRIALADLHDGICKARPDFARLDRELFIDACTQIGRQIGEIASVSVQMHGTSDPHSSVMKRVEPVSPAKPESLLRPATAAPNAAARPIRQLEPAVEKELVRELERSLAVDGHKVVRSQPPSFA